MVEPPLDKTRKPRLSLSFSGQQVLAVVAVMLAIGGLAFAVARPPLAPRGDQPQPMTLDSLGPRVLVIAPHPDDESLAPGGLVASAVASGRQVKVVVVTAGDAYRRAALRLTRGRLTPSVYVELGNLRHKETLAAISSLGLPPQDLLWLGYQDGSVNSLWDGNWDPADPHVGANGHSRSPYPFAWQPGVELCGANLAKNLEEIVRDYKPTSVVYPDPTDSHHDHWAVAAFTDYALNDTGYTGPRLGYLVHRGHYPFPWVYLPSARLQPPVPLVGLGQTWHSLPLDAATEKAKQRAIMQYRTQVAIPDLSVFMRSFVRTNEVFATWAPLRIGRLAGDTPGTDAAGAGATILREPVSSPLLLPRRGPWDVADVAVARGGDRVWVGIRPAGRLDPTMRYGVHIRLFGGGTAPERIDLAVTHEKVESSRAASGTVQPGGSPEVLVAGGRLWVSIPSKPFAGRTRIMVGADAEVRPGSRFRSRSLWRTVDL
jgi:N-acetyl-1-D-myo-inositol-2-amino-2-deoxy-alpha-D-glucopyranoside deacetylase